MEGLNPEHVLKKVLVLGGIGVGKTSLIKRFVDAIFSGSTAPSIGVGFDVKVIKDASTKTKLRLQLWDIPGRELPPSTRDLYVCETKMAVLMWDPKIEESFADIRKYLEMLQGYGLIGPNAKLNIPVIFAQGKSGEKDINKNISPDKDQIEKWVQEFGIAHYRIAETSAKEGQGIDEAFKWSVGPLLAQAESEIEAVVAQSVEVVDPKAERERLAAEKKAAKAQETAQKKAERKRVADEKKAERKRLADERQAKKIAKALEKDKADLDKAEAKRIAKAQAVSEKDKEEVGVGTGTEAVVENSVTEHLFKVAVMGEPDVGKTSLIKRFVDNLFSLRYRPTIGVDFALKIINWDDENIVRLQLWDIAGTERTGNMMRVYLKESVMAIVMWDVTRSATFEVGDDVEKPAGVKGYLKKLSDNCAVLPGNAMIPVIFLPAKVDLYDKKFTVTDEQTQSIEAWAKAYGITQFYIAEEGISSKDNAGIVQAIKKGVELIFNAMLGPSKSEEVISTVIPTQKYKSTPFKHTREARRKDLDAIDNPRENQKWLWLNYMSISDKGCTTCKSLNARIGSAVVKHDLDPVERDVLKLLRILDSLETSIPDKLLCRFSLFQETRTKIKEERELLYKTAKLIYEANKNKANQNNNNPNANANNNNNNVEAEAEAEVLHVPGLLAEEVLKLPKAAQAIIMSGKYELSSAPRNDSRVIEL